MSWVYLSHVLSEATPLYGSNGQVIIERARSMSAGDTSNNSDLALPAHSGTHLDAPRHFDGSGATLDMYSANHWLASSPWLVDASCGPAEILDLARLGPSLDAVPEQCDLLLLRTGAEAWRTTDPQTYSERGPGVGPDVAHWLRQNRKLRFLGMDFVSTSSFAHREVGREAHRVFLHQADGSPPIQLVEDMALSKLEKSPQLVWIVPLRFQDADGAPATIIAKTGTTGFRD